MKKTIKTTLAFVLLFTSVISLSGCKLTDTKPIVKRRFLLEVSGPGPDTDVQAKTDAPVLKIRRFTISGAFEGKNFVYRRGQFGYETDFYNEFLTPPATLIGEQVRRWLTHSSVFSSVLDAGSSADADYLLEGNIFALYGDYTDINKPAAVLGIRFVVISETNGSNRIKFDRPYKIIKPIESTKPSVLAGGMNLCLEEVLAAFEADLRKALAAQ